MGDVMRSAGKAASSLAVHDVPLVDAEPFVAHFVLLRSLALGVP